MCPQINVCIGKERFKRPVTKLKGQGSTFKTLCFETLLVSCDAIYSSIMSTNCNSNLLSCFIQCQKQTVKAIQLHVLLSFLKVHVQLFNFFFRHYTDTWLYRKLSNVNMHVDELRRLRRKNLFILTLFILISTMAQSQNNTQCN